VGSIETTNLSHQFRKIPKAVVGRASLFFVPDQSGAKLKSALRNHIESVFKQRQSANTLTIRFKQISDYWIGDTDNRIFTLASRAVEDVWGVKPLLVREGGTYGGISAFLEKALGAPALHLPMGQASDNAHLPNERMRVHNLVQGKKVLSRLLSLLSDGSE
jgi:acetylornithine deacetylase/succinyl-diaminopimelate desuccinylase-like protein